MLFETTAVCAALAAKEELMTLNAVDRLIEGAQAFELTVSAHSERRECWRPSETLWNWLRKRSAPGSCRSTRSRGRPSSFRATTLQFYRSRRRLRFPDKQGRKRKSADRRCH